jgi:hypothetical protein
VDEREKDKTESATMNLKDIGQESAGIMIEALRVVKSVMNERGKEFYNINSENWESWREPA